MDKAGDAEKARVQHVTLITTKAPSVPPGPETVRMTVYVDCVPENTWFGDASELEPPSSKSQ